MSIETINQKIPALSQKQACECLKRIAAALNANPLGRGQLPALEATIDNVRQGK